MRMVVLAQPRGDEDIGIRARVRVQKSKVRRFTLYHHFLSLYTSIWNVLNGNRVMNEGVNSKHTCETTLTCWYIGLQVSRPYKQAEFDIMFGEGICRLVSLWRSIRRFPHWLITIVSSVAFHGIAFPPSAILQRSWSWPVQSLRIWNAWIFSAKLDFLPF